VDRFSQFLEQPDYAKYIVGESVYKQVLEKIKIEPTFEAQGYKREERES
jgi:hypothetical protein